MKTCFIVNPRSGHAAAALPRVREFAARRGAVVRLTGRAGHARELAAEAVGEGFEVVAAVGGDGTLNETASAVADTPAIFGLVACGSGNGLGRHLGLHGSIERALAVFDDGVPRAIDTATASSPDAAGRPGPVRRFFNVAGVGFEADLSERFNRLTRRGLPRYLRTGLREWANRRPRNYAVEFGGTRREFRALSLTVANGSQYGNNVRIAPQASLDDGRLDLVVIPPLTTLGAVRLIWHLWRGTIARVPGIRVEPSASFVVHLPDPGLLQVDGEVLPAAGPVTFQVHPRSLRILTPREPGSGR